MAYWLLNSFVRTDKAMSFEMSTMKNFQIPGAI